MSSTFLPCFYRIHGKWVKRSYDLRGYDKRTERKERKKRKKRRKKQEEKKKEEIHEVLGTYNEPIVPSL